MPFTIYYDSEQAKASRGLVSLDEFLLERQGSVVGGTTFFERGAKVEPHWHDHCQLVYAASGTMVVMADEVVWLVPPHRAVWLPAMTDHSFHMSTPVEMHTIYLLEHPPVPKQLEKCCVLQVSPLMRELVDRVRLFQSDYMPDSPQARLVNVLLDELWAAPATTLFAPFPKDPRLQRLAQAISADPGDGRTLNDWANQIGASERTIARLFKRQTGMSFVQWRQQIRLFAALQLLAEGKSVTEVANTYGYNSTSAFINLFKKNLGTTPSRYFNQA